MCVLNQAVELALVSVSAHGEDGVGAGAVQVVHSSRRDRPGWSCCRLSRGSGWPPARASLTWARASAGGPLPIASSRMGHLMDAPGRGYDVLGFGPASGGNEMSRQLVLARIIEPASKLDSPRVLEEAEESRRRMRRSSGACRSTSRLRGDREPICGAHAGLEPASLVLYDPPLGPCRQHGGVAGRVVRRPAGRAAVVLRVRESRAHRDGRQQGWVGGTAMARGAPVNSGACSMMGIIGERVARTQVKYHRRAKAGRTRPHVTDRWRLAMSDRDRGHLPPDR
jgi:hypothetical protein